MLEGAPLNYFAMEVKRGLEDMGTRKRIENHSKRLKTKSYSNAMLQQL